MAGGRSRRRRGGERGAPGGLPCRSSAAGHASVQDTQPGEHGACAASVKHGDTLSRLSAQHHCTPAPAPQHPTRTGTARPVRRAASVQPIRSKVSVSLSESAWASLFAMLMIIVENCTYLCCFFSLNGKIEIKIESNRN